MRSLLAGSIVLLVLLPSIVFGAPAVTGVSGAARHNGSITITGAGFGAKTCDCPIRHAAPRIWDPCTTDSENDPPGSAANQYWPGDCFPTTCSGTPSETPYKMEYRTSFHGYSAMPHSRVDKFLSAAAITCNGGWDSGTASNFFITANEWNNYRWFGMFYYRMSSNFSISTAADSDNIKEATINATPGGTYYEVTKCSEAAARGLPTSAECEDGHDGYLCWGNGNSAPPEAKALGTRPDFWQGCTSFCDTSSCSWRGIETPNPMDQWLHIEMLQDECGYSFMGSDNQDETWQPIPPQNYHQCMSLTRVDYYDPIYHPIKDAPESIMIGGFLRHPRASSTGNYRFWSAIYLDDSYCRVILGNRSTWTASFVREPQIPTSWSVAGTSITATVNLGALSAANTNVVGGNNVAYIYIWDDNNDCNGGAYDYDCTGYPVALDFTGECVEDSDCNDSNPCTDDTCVVDTCYNTNNNSNTCDDSLYCTGTESCVSGTCVSTGDPCGTGYTCNETTDSCDVATTTTSTIGSTTSSISTTSSAITTTSSSTSTSTVPGNAATVRSEATGTAVGSGSSLVTITKPATVADGDYLIVVLATDDDIPLLSAPSGWTLADSNSSDVGYDRQIGLYYKYVATASSEPATYSFPLGVTDNAAWWIAAVDGIDPSTPQDEPMSGNAVALSNATAPAAPSITTATGNAFVIAGWSVHSEPADTDVTMPGGAWTAEAEDINLSYCTLAVASQTFVTPGATGAVSISEVTSTAETSCGQWAFRVEALTTTSSTSSTTTSVTTSSTSSSTTSVSSTTTSEETTSSTSSTSTSTTIAPTGSNVKGISCSGGNLK